MKNLTLPKYDHLVLVENGIWKIFQYLTTKAKLDLVGDTIQHELNRELKCSLYFEY